jgi:FAD/FMN-containing dehydrogenase
MTNKALAIPHDEILNAPSIADLRARFKGRVIGPEDPDYDAARAVFYVSIDCRPAVVIRAANAEDVARAVMLARETGLELAVRGGGHSIAGHSASEGGIVLDLSGLKELDIDVKRRTAWAGAGLTAGEYTAAAGAYGLATGFGDTGEVGIGGLTVGGGLGFLVRKYGMTIDELLAVEIVTADGQTLLASADSHLDLFWAIRGGGGNFGVVTRFKFRLHEVDAILGGMLILPATPEIIAGFVAAADTAPDELSTIANIMVAPPMPFLPAEVHGTLIMMVMLVYAGESAAGERVIAPIRDLAKPLVDMVRPMRYSEIYHLNEGGPPPAEEVAHSMFLDQVDHGVAEEIVNRLRASTAMMKVVQLRVLGGAMASVPAGATAYAHRRRRIMAVIVALYENAAETPEHEAWLSDFVEALRQGEPGVYANFLGDEGPARVREAYPGSTWDRLAAIKAQYDPTNLFRHNHNIPPADNNGRY